MNKEPRIRYTRVRKVKDLVRANDGDAGLDFFFPEDITLRELIEKQVNDYPHSITYGVKDKNGIPYAYTNYVTDIPEDKVTSVTLNPLSRILIPSGIRVLLEPKNSMLMAANKSGIVTKMGLIFGAEIVDSPYTGEVHISLINVSNNPVKLVAGEKLVQFIHVPVYQAEPEEIPEELYDEIAKDWGTRGTKGFGSSDKLNYEDEISLRDGQFS